MTASIGIAPIDTGAGRSTDLAEGLRVADTNMYGRKYNRTTLPRGSST